MAERALTSAAIGPELLLAVELVAFALLYLIGARRSAAGRGRGWPAWRTACFLAGLAVLAVALIGFERAAEDSLIAHMEQHLLLLFVAPPLLLAGAPHRLAIAAFPATRRLLGGLGRSPAARALGHPVLALLAFAAVLIATHVPAVYDAALASPPLHALEHLAYLAAGLLLWAPVLAAPPRPLRLSPLLAVLYLLVAMLPGSLIGIWLMTAGEVVYDHYLALGIERSAQRAAGMVMWAGAAPFLLGGALLAGWIGAVREERRQREREQRAASRNGRLVGGAAALLLGVAAATLALGSDERAASRQPDTAGPAGAAESAVVERGRALFAEGCSDCHGFDARGIDGVAPTLYGAGEASADFYLRTGRMPLDDPSDQPQRSESPYGEAEIDALIAYVGSLGEGPEIPAVDPELGDLARGQELFTETCAGCHQIVGQGGIVTRGIVPDLQQAEPVDVAEAVEIGPYVMPTFERFTDHEVNSLARYVDYTKDPEDRGGWGIGHIGPIPEGMVAWLLAGAALLLAIRLIGERTTR